MSTIELRGVTKHFGGFTAVDDATTWTRGASADFLAAIGQPAAP